MKKIKTKIFIASLLLGIFALAVDSKADITLPWSSSYVNLTSDWTASSCVSGWPCAVPGGDGISQNYNSGTNEGHHEQIIPAANYDFGAGGRGQRHWLGIANDDQSEGCNVYFTTPVREIWIRWYMRFENGFQFNDEAGWKVFYFKEADAQNVNAFLMGYGATGILYSAQVGDGQNYWTNNYDLSDIFGGSASDGSWHYYELHIKSETIVSPAADGEVDLLVDGTLRMHHANVNHGLQSRGVYLGGFSIGDNAHGVLTQDHYVDFDDIAISTSGYIGPISGGDVIPPGAPSGLSVQ